MRVVDQGRGWVVIAEWYGEIRTVHTGVGRDDLERMRDCMRFAEG